MTPRRIDLLTGFLAGFALFCFVMAAADFQASYCSQQSGDKYDASSPAQAGTPSVTQSGQNTDQTEKGKHAKTKPSVACGVLGVPGAVVHFMDHHEGFFVGGFTFFLFLSTTLLWRSTERLWEAGERQVAANTADSERRLRAYPGVTGAYIKFEGNKISIRFVIRNFTATPVYKFRYRISHELCAKDDIFIPDTSVDFKDTVWDMAAGAMSKMEDFRDITVQEHAAILIGDLTLMVWGRAEYEDAFGKPHHIEFIYRCDDIQSEIVEHKFLSGATQRVELRVCTEPDAIRYESN